MIIKQSSRINTFQFLLRNWLVMVVAGLLFHTSFANNLQLSEVRLLDEQSISFEVSWENSWNLNSTPGNHDAIWVFAKLKRDNGNWEPLLFDNSSAAHTSIAPDQIEIESVQDGLGVFLKRSTTGTGDVPSTEIILQLDFPLSDGEYELQVFGVEMVWIPSGPFWAGDSTSNFNLGYGNSFAPWMVLNESDIALGPEPGFSSGNSIFPPDGDIPASYPKGTEGFYCMKYELSQGQYVDFLNHLTSSQQIARTVPGPSGDPGSHALTTGLAYRNGIRLYNPATTNQAATFGCDLAQDGTFNSEEDGQNRACNFLNWGDLLAYLDWSGLSPMTEFEYEKACRGPEAPVGGEFAWGTSEIMDANTPLQDGTPTEAVAEMPIAPAGLGSHGYDGPQGPLRCGFAAHASSTRLESGASYYGLMEMSGNLWELCVNIGPEGIAFDGSLGDGRINSDGNADQAGWPDQAGGGYRGGGWNSGIIPGFRDLAVSDRYYTGLPPELRRSTSGGRGVRR